MQPRLPTINLSSLLKGDNSVVIKEICSALQNIGAFYATNHGISQDTISTIIKHTKDFFNLSNDKKSNLSYKNNKGYRGYLHFGSETTADQKDAKEGMLFGCGDCQESSPMYGHNVYPNEEDIPCFEDDIRSFTSSSNNLCGAITRAFFNELKADKSFLEKTFNPAFSVLNLWHYPSSPCRDQLGIGEHTDYEALTLLLQDEIGGLQVLSKDGEWIEVPPKEGTLLFMIGDAMECWTNGLYQAPVHRVKNTALTSRYSVAYFFQPNLETTIKPLDIPGISEKHFEPTRKGITMPYHYGQQLYKGYCKSFGNIRS